MKITEGCVGKITVPPGKAEVFVWDEDLPGFGIRKKANGQASYIVRTALRRATLGNANVPGLLKKRLGADGKPVEGIRQEAERYLREARNGRDIAGEAREARKAKAAQKTVGWAVPRFLEARAPDWRPRYLLEVKRHTEKRLLPLHDTPIEQLARQQIGELLGRIVKDHGPIEAKKVRSSLCVFLRWSADQGYAPEEWADYPPVPKVGNGGKATSRDRVLSTDELLLLWCACGVDDYGRIVRLLMLTGQRRDEIGSLAWSEIRSENGATAIHLPKERTKNKQGHTVALADMAVALLPKQSDGSPFVFGLRPDSGFSGWSKAKAGLNAAIKQPWRLHDLRRTFATLMNEHGLAAPHIIEAVLNHISGHKAGVAGVYNRATYETEKRQALEAWAQFIAELVATDERAESSLTNAG